MTRILFGLVLIALVIGVVGFLPSWGTLGLAVLLLAAAVLEYFPLAERGAPLPRTVVLFATAAVALAVGYWPGAPLEVALVAVMLVVGALAVASLQPGEDVARRVAVALFPVLYIGVPVGATVAVRDRWGAGAMFALLFTVMASDTAQYYGGRLMGRRLLAPVISPKKTVEGALSGFGPATWRCPSSGSGGCRHCRPQARTRPMPWSHKRWLPAGAWRSSRRITSPVDAARAVMRAPRPRRGFAPPPGQG